MRIISLLVFCFTSLSFAVSAADLADTTGGNPFFLVAQNINPIQGRDRVIREDKRETTTNNTSTSKDVRSTVNSNITASGTQLCAGEFAFCASSTCVKTGREIEVAEKDGKSSRKFPEVSCKCPIIDKKIAVEQNGVPLVGIAAVNEGNMRGSCIPPSPGTIWSYFSKEISLYPQESATPKFATKQSQSQTCNANSGTGSNCWNFLCKIDPELTNGVRTATCLCPIDEGLYGAKAHKNADFVTYAGTYFVNPKSACSQYPVGFPLQLMQ